MKLSLAALRSNKDPLEGQSDMERVVPVKVCPKEEPQGTARDSNVSSIAWAIAAIAWAIAIYLIERERQQAQVEVARLEMEAKK